MTDPRDELRIMTPDVAEGGAKDIVAKALSDYADKRARRYGTLQLRELVEKDLLMMTLRGVPTAKKLLEQAFLAWESSSEETHMGGTAQEVAIALSTGAIDLGDILIERDGSLWVVEVKSQTNTVNSRSLPRIIQVLKRRVDQYSRYQPSRRREVRAMIGVLRGEANDEVLRYRALNHLDQDINGFEYRYLVGRSFWLWLTNRPSMFSLVGDTSSQTTTITRARDACFSRLSEELASWLDACGEPDTASALLNLVERGERPPTSAEVLRRRTRGDHTRR